MTAFLDLHRPGDPLLLPNPWDAGSGPHPRRARLPGAGHHQQRVRRHARAPRPVGDPRRGARARRRGRRRHRRARSRPTWRTGSPTTRTAWPRPSGSPRRPGWPAARSRTRTPATTRSTTLELAAERVAAAVEAAGDGLSSPRGPRTTCTAATTSPTRSRGCSATRRPARTCCTRPGSPTPTTSRTRRAARSTGRSTCWPSAGAPAVPELAELGVARISVGGAFAFAASARWSPRPTRVARRRAPTGTWTRAKATRGRGRCGLDRLSSQVEVRAHHDRAVDRAGRSSRPGWRRCAPGR